MSASHIPQKEAPESETFIYFINAVKLNNTRGMIHILELGVGITPASLDEALIIAAQQGHDAAIRILCSAGANPQTTTPRGNTPLYFATHWNHEQAAHTLCELGADPNIGRPTPLIEAARRGHERITRTLCQFGADLHLPDFSSGATPVFVAAQNGHINIIRALCDYGASPSFPANIKDVTGAKLRDPIAESLLLQVKNEMLINTRWPKLNFADCPLTSEDMSKLADFHNEEKKNILVHLCLARTQLTSESVPHIVRILKGNRALATLDLSGNLLNAADIEAIAKALAQNSQLEALDLSNLPLGDKAVPFILEIIENTNLVSLNLANTRFSAEGTKLIGKALERNKTICDLNLHGNVVASDDIQRFSTCMNTRRNLNITLGFAAGSDETNRYMLRFQKATQTSLAQLCSSNITSEIKAAEKAEAENEAKSRLLSELSMRISKLHIEVTLALHDEIHQIESRLNFVSRFFQQPPKLLLQPLHDQLYELERNPPATLEALQTKLSAAIESVTVIKVAEDSDRIARLLDTLLGIKRKVDNHLGQLATRLMSLP
jgi:ankyrin repeat protein